jgi:hypothetical protein
MIIKTSIGFLNDDSDDALVADITRLLAALTGNPAYPKAAALLLLIKAALEDFRTAQAAAGGGGVVLTAAKMAKRKALCALVRSLANDVNEECLGDLTTLLSSGFPIQKPQHFPIGDLPTPATPTLTLGVHSGELDASVPPIYGAQTYNWQVATASAPTVILQTLQTTAASTTFAGLAAGVVHVVSASAVGAAGVSDWSGTASQMVV